jgi:hypothetical protein
MSLPLTNIGQAVVLNGQVYSADLYVCRACGREAHGTLGEDPIRPLDDWDPTWRLQPTPLKR